MHCQDCIIQMHVHLPFHRFLEWKGAHFACTSYGQLNGVYALGHCGEKCPNRERQSQGWLTVIVHTNGVHTMRVEYCCCLNAPKEHIQLTRARLFPASITQPATVFTFAALNEFHQHSLTSKKAAYDYYDALRKLTSSAFPQDIPVSRSSSLMKTTIHITRDSTESLFRVLLSSSNLETSGTCEEDQTSTWHRQSPHP